MAELDPGAALESADTLAPDVARGDLLPPGARVGRYLVIGSLARGGMGTVYKAFDPELDRPVALKIVEPVEAEAETAQQLRVRVAREAQAIAKLTHPNVVAVHDVGLQDGRVFIAMEFVAGVTLRAWTRRRERRWREVVGMFVEAGRGLAAAHAAGLVHRDVKPENVLVGDDGRPRVVDFGLVRAAGEQVPVAGPAPPVDARPRRESLTVTGALATPLTRAGEVMGTPGYMAPEQYVGDEVDATSDQFGFCIALYEALFGVRPFRGHTIADIKRATLRGVPDDGADRRPVPARVRAVVVRGLAASKPDRHPSMDALLAALERELAGTRRKVVWGAVAALAVVAAVAVVARSAQPAVVAGPQPCRDSGRKLAGAWDAPARQALAAAFEARASAQARSLADRVAGDFDRFTAAWVAKHRSVCEATRVHGEQSEQALDLRMRCLDRQLGDVRELVAVLRDADADTLDRAAVLSGRLPELADCDDVAALGSVAPPPKDPAARAAIERVEAKLARVRVLTSAAKLDEASALAEQARTAAIAIGYEPLVAQTYLAQVAIADTRGQGGPARVAALEALNRAERVGDDVLRASALAHLTFIVGYHLHQPEYGRAYGRQAEAILDRLGGHRQIRAQLLDSLGAVEHASGHYLDAVERLVASLRVSEQVYGADSFEHVSTLNNLGSALTELGRNEEAVGHLERALTLVESYFGPEHLHVPALATNIGIALHDLGDGAGAERAYQRAIAVYEAKLGISHAMLAAPVVNLGDVLFERGDLDAAIESYRRSVAIREHGFAATNPRVATGLLALGRALSRRGDHDEAFEVLSRAHAIWRAAHGDHHGDTVRAGVALAAAMRRRGRPLAAGRLLGDVRTQLGEDGDLQPAAGPVLVEQARLALLLGRPRAAIAALEAALAVAASPTMRTADVANARFLLARAYAESGRRSRARAAALDARELFASRRALGERRVAELDALIARLDGAGRGSPTRGAGALP